LINNKKIRIHVKNNHWAPRSFPNTPEGEKVFTITKDHFDKALEKRYELKEKVEIFIDWDEDNFDSSISKSDILISWDFPTSKIKKISPNLKWVHCISAGIEHLLPLNWMPEQLILTNNGGVHSKKAGEYGLMSVLMLHNHLPKIISNQMNKKFKSLFSNPIARKTIVVVGTGNLGGSMIRLLAPLGPNIIGVNRKGRPVEGCAKVVTVDKIDNVLPEADILYLAAPETPETKYLIDHKRLNLLKPSCGVVNIGRQSVMDYKALFARLENNEIAGAILDVFDPEPIDPFSKIWNVPNLIITPHVSGDDGGSYIRLTLELFVKNLELFINNKPLVNQIDKKLGY
jgi:phosphoglycerate dehydrogenase-like enzyme